MKKLLKKKVNVFGKGVPVLAIFVLGIALVSAALMGYFGVITGLVTVNQGLTVDGHNWNDPVDDYVVTMYSLEAKTVSSEIHTLANSADVDATVTLDTVCTAIPEDKNSCDVLVNDDRMTTEYVLSVSGNAGTEEKIRINADEGMTLGDLVSMSWEVYTTLGYPAHVDIILEDIDGEANIDSITAEMAFNKNMAILDIADSLPEDWVKTFELISGDGFGVIDNSTTFWVTRHGSGTWNAPFGTLRELKDGIVIPSLNPNDVGPTITISSTTKIIGFEIEVDNWVVNTDAKVRNIQINGADVDKVTVLAEEELDFQIVTDFPKMMKPAEYTITTTVDTV